MAMVVAGGCTNGSLGGGGNRRSGAIVIGLLAPLSGPYQVNGPELTEGFQLYLDTHGGRLGEKKVKVVVADEGDGKQVAANSAKKLIEQDRASVIVGTTTVDSLLSIQTMVRQAGIPFIGTGGRPSTLKDLDYIWHASWQSREPGAAIADYLRTTIDGPIFAIGPDYQGGWDNINGFVEPFLAGGGKLANDGGRATWTPWPNTTNFLPYLNKIAASGAGAVYAFYAGTAAVAFVQQYAQAGLQGRIPLYGPGFLTEDGILPARGRPPTGSRPS